LYYLAFIIYIIALKFETPNTNIFSAFYLQYLIFIQNFDPNHYKFFGQSWSLSIEEYFYLLLPFVFAVFKKIKIKPENLYSNIIKLIFIIIIIKFGVVFAYNFSMDCGYAVGIRRFIPLRLDALLIGVLFACLKINNKEIYNKFLNKKTLTTSLIMLALLTFYFSYTFFNTTLVLNIILFKAFFWSILNFSFAFLVIFFENNNFINKNLSNFSLIKTFFEKTSIYSYSIYLFHEIILNFYLKATNSFHNLQKSFIPVLLMLVTMYLVSAFLYKFYEKPIMDLRGKF
jgi:peptidoglycan/LPS O-acetylase OafA/YrhL